ncbi:hypothetical protein ACEYW6_00980 [Nostoc sp. UIC 10607]
MPHIHLFCLFACSLDTWKMQECDRFIAENCIAIFASNQFTEGLN